MSEEKKNKVGENNYSNDSKTNEYLKMFAKTRELPPNNLSNLFKNFAESVKKMDALSKQLVNLGVIRNSEAVKSFITSPYILEIPDIISQIKMHDAVISFSKSIKRNIEILDRMTFPYAPLYKGILNNLDEKDIDSLASVIDENNLSVDTAFIDEESSINNTNADDIKRPVAFDIAVKINMYITITNDHMENNSAPSEEEKTFWKNKLLPILLMLGHFFMIWAMGDIPISEMEGVKAINGIVKTITEYNNQNENEDNVNEDNVNEKGSKHLE